jgi:hypothetical protein
MSEPVSIEPRMLERRVSNNRADLSNDQQMNFILAWFNQWSDLEKDDFVPVLGNTMVSNHSYLNGDSGSMTSSHLDQLKKRRPSLFDCQVTLYRTWIHGWSDDQKSYLILRLREIDQNFSKKYDSFLQYGLDCPQKDYFEPGIPAELDRTSEKGSNPASLNTSMDDCQKVDGKADIIFKVADNTNIPNTKSAMLVELENFEKLNMKDKTSRSVQEDVNQDLDLDDHQETDSLRDSDCLSPISEECEA